MFICYLHHNLKTLLCLECQAWKYNDFTGLGSFAQSKFANTSSPQSSAPNTSSPNEVRLGLSPTASLPDWGTCIGRPGIGKLALGESSHYQISQVLWTEMFVMEKLTEFELLSSIYLLLQH